MHMATNGKYVTFVWSRKNLFILQKDAAHGASTEPEVGVNFPLYLHQVPLYSELPELLWAVAKMMLLWENS